VNRQETQAALVQTGTHTL